MVPWVSRPVLDLDMARRSAEQGFPPEAFISSRRLLAAVSEQIPPKARILAQLARWRTWNRFQREMAALAKLAETDWRDLMLASLSYDLVLASHGCSTIALPTREGPVLARNMDWAPEDLLAQASYLLCYRRRNELRFASAGWPGGVGIVTGMSGRGFAVALNAVSGPEKVAKTGYPVLLHLRRVVEDAANFDKALKMLKRQRLTSPALFTLVGTENHQRVVIERSPTRHALRWANGLEPLLTTNHYRILFQSEPAAAGIPTELSESTCSRYDALCHIFAAWSADRIAVDAELLYALSDVQVIQSITAQHVIFRPRTRAMGLWVPRRLIDA